MQTILGANGAIGTELAKALKSYTSQIRLVSRNPRKVNESDELFAADLTDPEQLDKAVAGSEVVYITIAFEYRVKVWQKYWPAFMRNLISSCKKHGPKIVFFDNVYMYDKSEIVQMKEDAHINPPSKKGKVRAQIAEMLFNEVEKGTLKALIARSGDFYGPGAVNSVIKIVFDNFSKGKKAFWIANAHKIHNFGYTPDSGKATALLGNSPDAFNQVWHIPSCSEKLTGVQWMEAIAKEMNVTPRFQVLPVWMMSILGIFIPVLGELKEMAYQYDRDYYFDSSKFQKRFQMELTSVATGIRETVRSFRPV